MKIVVGLGNPGEKYKYTRHNIGFFALEKFVEAEHLGKFSYNNVFGAEILETRRNEDKLICIKPMKFMNVSGIPLFQIANFYKIGAEDVLVLHDDIDLSVGTVKFKIGGGHAGHNGLKSIITSLGKKFMRIRIGVDRPNTKEEVVDYVLGKFCKKDKEIINNILPDVFEFIENFLK